MKPSGTKSLCAENTCDALSAEHTNNNGGERIKRKWNNTELVHNKRYAIVIAACSVESLLRCDVCR